MATLKTLPFGLSARRGTPVFQTEQHWKRPRMHAGRRGFARRRRLRFRPV